MSLGTGVVLFPLIPVLSWGLKFSRIGGGTPWRWQAPARVSRRPQHGWGWRSVWRCWWRPRACWRTRASSRPRCWSGCARWWCPRWARPAACACCPRMAQWLHRVGSAHADPGARASRSRCSPRTRSARTRGCPRSWSARASRYCCRRCSPEVRRLAVASSLKAVAERFPFRDLLILPLRVRGRVLGTLALGRGARLADLRRHRAAAAAGAGGSRGGGAGSGARLRGGAAGAQGRRGVRRAHPAHAAHHPGAVRGAHARGRGRRGAARGHGLAGRRPEHHRCGRPRIPRGWRSSAAATCPSACARTWSASRWTRPCLPRRCTAPAPLCSWRRRTPWWCASPPSCSARTWPPSPWPACR